jgi:hypothetical protein
MWQSHLSTGATRVYVYTCCFHKGTTSFVQHVRFTLVTYRNRNLTLFPSGDRTLGRDSGTLELDAESSTVDPDNAPGDLSCAWTCTDISNDQPCYSALNPQSKITLPNQCKVSLSSTEFAAGKTYRIKYV